MNLLLDLWCATKIILERHSSESLSRTSLSFGILYLAFQAFPYIFGVNHGFDAQSTGLAFIGLGIGMVLGTALNVSLIM